MHVCMTKVISISDDAYYALKKLKARSSFSEIIVNLAIEKAKRNIMEFAGTLSGKEGEEMKERIYEERKLKSKRFE